jgi:toxin ParE1/3/4
VKPVQFHRAARAEIKAAAEHYVGIHPRLGSQFYDALDAVFCEIRAQPARFRMFDPPARRHFGPRFPYAVVYLDLPDRVWIVAVMHFKRRPGYWTERLPD